MEVDVLFGEVQLAEHHFILFLEWNFVGLVSDSERELSVLVLKERGQKLAGAEDVVFGHFLHKFFGGQALEGVVEVGHAQEQTDEQDFFVIEEVLGDVAV